MAGEDAGAAQVLRDRGLRVTRPRLRVLGLFLTRASALPPQSHEAVMVALAEAEAGGTEGEGPLDRATVWRVLSDLCMAGVLHRVDLGDRVWRYGVQPLVPETGAGALAHFLCEGCGGVDRLPPLEVRVQGGALPAILQGSGLRLQVVGQCLQCVPR